MRVAPARPILARRPHAGLAMGGLLALALGLLAASRAPVPAAALMGGGAALAAVALVAGGRSRRLAAELRDREQRLARLAFLDRETGLGARPALEQDLTGRIAGAGAPLFVAALGVDRFERLRGLIGHERAAQAVRAAGERLGTLEPEATVCRLSADVLALAFPAADTAAAEARVAALVAQLEQPLEVGGDTLGLTFSAGLAPAGDGDPIVGADLALGQARAAHRRIAGFDAAARGDPSADLALMSGMLWAIRSGEVELFHQPRFDLRRRRVTAVEGLVRWRHPTRGLLSPDDFIPLAEATGHIRTLTDWVLRQAIADQATLSRLGHEIEVSVNISGRLLCDRGFAEGVDRSMAAAAGRICFEVTEAAVLENPDAALEQLDRFRRAGVGLAVDDHGRGPSSLDLLKRIGGQELKIDTSLVAGVAASQRDALVVRSAIDLAHGLGMRVTAEGVETAQAFQLLAAMGCDAVQGYLIARPQPLNELLVFLREDGETRGYG